MRTSRALLCALPLLLAGCMQSEYLPTTDVTPEGYQALARSWVGARENELIASWGRPTRREMRGDTEVLVYSNAVSELYQRPQPSFLWHFTDDVQYPSGSGEMLRMHYEPGCETTFELVNQRVTRWSARGGDGCMTTDY